MKIYLTQVAQFIEKLTGKKQQIIDTTNPNISYIEYEELEVSNQQVTLRDDPMDAVFIIDEDIDIKTIAYSCDFGFGLNVSQGNLNNNKIHLILWKDFETEIDENGIYIYEEDFDNGIVNIYIINKDGKYEQFKEITEEMIDEIKSYPI